jgi:hypothetical protein
MGVVGIEQPASDGRMFHRRQFIAHALGLPDLACLRQKATYGVNRVLRLFAV